MFCHHWGRELFTERKLSNGARVAGGWRGNIGRQTSVGRYLHLCSDRGNER
jgi:hypothetical protein